MNISKREKKIKFLLDRISMCGPSLREKVRRAKLEAQLDKIYREIHDDDIPNPKENSIPTDLSVLQAIAASYDTYLNQLKVLKKKNEYSKVYLKPWTILKTTQKEIEHIIERLIDEGKIVEEKKHSPLPGVFYRLTKDGEIFVKSNPITPTQKQIDWATEGAEGIAFYDIDPIEFLRLTAESPEHFHQLLKHSKSMDFYNSPEIQENLVVHPAIWINDDGTIDAHEGRHRAAATYNAGEKTYRIAIIADERGWPVKTHGWRWKRRLKIPPLLTAQYMKEYTHEVDPTKLEEIPVYYGVETEQNPSKKKNSKVKKNPIADLIFEEVE